MLKTELVGARIHNLKGVSIEVRPGEVLALTGVSGSGKSSLAFDTLYAEGQRRFVESFSPYARQFLERLERPPYESLSKVGAGVAVDRSAPVKSSRSTLATMADLEPYLAGLFAKESVAHCPEHHLPGVELGLPGAVARVLERFPGRTVLVTLVKSVAGKEEYLGLREDLLRAGYRRVLVGGVLSTLDDVKPSAAAKAGKLHVVLDRVQVEASKRSRLGEAIETAFRETQSAEIFADAESLVLVPGLSCPTCARRLETPRPGYFSYESALGACEACKGFGRTIGIDWNKVIPDPRLSLRRGAIRAWRGDSAAWERKQLEKWAEFHGIPMDVPFASLSASQKDKILHGKSRKGEPEFWGVSHWFSWLETKTYKMHVRVFLSRYRAYEVCATCRGTHLSEHSRGFLLQGYDLGSFHALSVSQARACLATFDAKSEHGVILRKELLSRLEYLEKVGLGYLGLDRSARTLSGGEAQRVTLTAALGTSLHHALFVLDEPSVGLHPADVAALSELIVELARRDNAVVLVEHEPLLIRAAHRVVELGPGAGERGGNVVFDGTVKAALGREGATARALAKPMPVKMPSVKPRGYLEILGASENNLQGIDVKIPLGKFTYLAGPSGSGKSTLAVDVLYRAVAKEFGDQDVDVPGKHASIEGMGSLIGVELVDQAPLGRTSRGNPATYTKAWDHIRKAFASEPSAVMAGFGPGTFSFNVAGGRCEACSGEGFETIEMQFLADVSLSCAECGGKRFRPEVLAVTHRGRTVSDVLEMTVEETIELFRDVPAVRRALGPLVTLGLGYLRLGQPLSTLSGGEAERLKVARALAEPKPGTLYVLDEPSAGLHADEVLLLIEAIQMLVRASCTVLVVDHDLLLLADAEHVIELGPGSGADGGKVVFEGTPLDLLKADTKTARALRGDLEVPKASKKADAKAKGLSVVGAREHTLKSLEVEIPHQKLTVITGPSGSGKSTLAFDVIFAEGQRRFLETLTPYARRFLPTLPRPNVDLVDGVPPSIALEQRTTRIGARSTVATVTEVAHYLRLGFAKLGTPHCPTHDVPIERARPERILERIAALKGKGSLLAPVVSGRKGTYQEVFEQAARAQIAFAVADGVRVETNRPPKLAKTKEHTISLFVRENVAFSEVTLEELKKALELGSGSVLVNHGGQEQRFSTRGSCPHCGYAVGEIDPRYFSFNTKQGQCEECEGAGVIVLEKSRKKGDPGEMKVCSSCSGARLGPFARKVEFFGRTYPELGRLTVLEVERFVSGLHAGGAEALVLAPILEELRRRLSFLLEVGLGYLSLDRDASTLSGGEIQRLRLAAQLGAGLTGALYVLDEPTIGLHPRDTGRLLENLRRLVDLGSSVLLVEHDEDVIRAADHLVDLGPEGGKNGGYILASGTPKKVLANPKSPTARALAEERTVRTPRSVSGVDTLVLHGAKAQNLRGDAATFPIGRLTSVVGVSGSGKSTLVRGVLLPALREKLERVTVRAGAHERLTGYEPLRRAIAVDQSPIGRTPRSVPATFLGIWDEIRAIYAKAPDAQVRGFGKERFSFNASSGGRCPTCEGQGAIAHEMSFLPDVVTTCPSCDGLRFDERTLEVRYLDKNIGEVLAMSASEAIEHFAAHPRITRSLKILDELGAGYVTLGQGSHTLSGGEAQRLKLASELAAGAKHEATLYVLDEPTTGLHVGDVSRLVRVLEKLVERGDTVVVIEHHPDVIRQSDWVVELGPEGGPEGGRIVFSGTPRELAKKKTATGLALRAIASA